jgi:hypothetical protein
LFDNCHLSLPATSLLRVWAVGTLRYVKTVRYVKTITEPTVSKGKGKVNPKTGHKGQEGE